MFVNQCQSPQVRNRLIAQIESSIVDGTVDFGDEFLRDEVFDVVFRDQVDGKVTVLGTEFEVFETHFDDEVGLFDAVVPDDPNVPL